MRRKKTVLFGGFTSVILLFSLYVARQTNQFNFFAGARDLARLECYLATVEQESFEVPDFIYIAHAGGGLNGATYLNTREAFDNASQHGVDYIEVDFHYSKDSVVVASHDYEDRTVQEFLEDKSSGTHIQMSDALEWLKNRKVMLVTDIKTDNIRILQNIALRHTDVLNQIIPQAYSITEIIELKKLGFKNIIFTNYISRYPNNIIERMSELRCLYAITLSYDVNFRSMQHLGKFRKLTTPIFTHTINDEELTRKLMKSGCRGIYTDFLLRPSLKKRIPANAE